MNRSKISKFKHNGKVFSVEFVEAQDVKEGVECDVYNIIGDESWDLAIVHVEKSYKTPLQRVLRGRETIEGYFMGSGIFMVELFDGTIEKYIFDSSSAIEDREVIVHIGCKMQWTASDHEDLVFYEICKPPYADGRFINLD